MAEFKVMHLVLLWSFAATALLIIIAPGLDTAMVLRTAAVDGRRSGLFAAIGIGIGCLGWGVAVSLGLGALLHTLPLAFTVLQWSGAAYLVWLGVRLLNSTRTSSPAPLDDAELSKVARPTDALLRALGGNLLNPKVGLFYLTLLPQFIPHGGAVAPWSLVLTCIHVALAVLWFMVLAASTTSLASVLQRQAVKRGIDVATACVFLGFGAELVLTRGF